MSDIDILIRKLTHDDIVTVHQLGKMIFDWPSERVLWNESLVESYCVRAQTVSFVAEYDSQVIGFVLCLVQNEQGYVGWLAVAPAWRRKGVGTRLVRQALEALQTETILLTSALVREDGDALRLLKRFDFRESGSRKLDVVLSSVQSAS